VFSSRIFTKDSPTLLARSIGGVDAGNCQLAPHHHTPLGGSLVFLDPWWVSHTRELFGRRKRFPMRSCSFYAPHHDCVRCSSELLHVHVIKIRSCALLANQLCRIKWFRSIENNPSLKRHVLAAAVASGVTAAFGTSIGGVLFSIEVTSMYFQVREVP
jgi:hypothetical protein